MDRETFDRIHEVRTDGQVHLGPLNLDAMSESELEVASTHPALHAEVQLYACWALAARKARLVGDVSKACRFEERMELLYEQRIPKACRW